MNNRIIITSLECAPGERVASVMQDERLMELTFLEEEKTIPVHTIVIGRVVSVSKNLQAAFLDIGNGVHAYYPLKELPGAVFTKKISQKPIVQDEELLVQISREAVKTKAPMVTTRLSLSGKYCVVTNEAFELKISSKLEERQKKLLRETLLPLLEETPLTHSLLLRTNSVHATPEEMVDEYISLSQKLDGFLKKANYQPFGSVLYRPLAGMEALLQNLFETAYEEIVTDDPKEAGHLTSITEKPVRLYTDSDYPIRKLYNLDRQVSDALRAKVWLKSGAYLVIEPTEALVAIDVNTGKCETGKNREETFFRINCEAAVETARQLRLRKLSGMILVDFINMKDKSHQDELLHVLRRAFLEDSLHPVVVDITKLGLVEITRKKCEKTLYEKLRGYDIICHNETV